LRPIWEQNTKEEALLGVSMTGILGNDLFLDKKYRPIFLDSLRTLARDTNEIWAETLGIKSAAAITCVKPEGTVSQLTLTKSGIHAGHAPYYTRRVRQDNKDPLTDFMVAAGVPSEPCIVKPDQTTIFSFPVEDKGLNRDDLTAVEHLDIWLDFQRYWCEHKPSVTISVREHEWMEVGAWVYKHFDECTGVSFLPYDGGSYRQAPYEEIPKEQFKKDVADMPHLKWNDFIEFKDMVEGAQSLACTAGVCTI
jgi:ribonucleoside-diphosphate reductase alpha chain